MGNLAHTNNNFLINDSLQFPCSYYADYITFYALSKQFRFLIVKYDLPGRFGEFSATVRVQPNFDALNW